MAGCRRDGEKGGVIGRAGRKSGLDEGISRGLGEGQRMGQNRGIGKTEKSDKIERKIRHEEGQYRAGRARLIAERRSIGHGTSSRHVRGQDTI